MVCKFPQTDGRSGREVAGKMNDTCRWISTYGTTGMETIRILRASPNIGNGESVWFWLLYRGKSVSDGDIKLVKNGHFEGYINSE